MVVSMETEERKRRDTLKKVTRDTNDSLKNYYDEIIGFAWLLLITREPNQALRDWSGIENPSELITALLTKQAVPKRRKKGDPDTFQIGDLYFDHPYTEVWEAAILVANALSTTLIAGTYGTTRRMYDNIIFAKAREAVKLWSMKTDTIDRTVKVYQFICFCPNHKAKIEFTAIKKDLVQATATRARRQNTGLEKGGERKEKTNHAK